MCNSGIYEGSFYVSALTEKIDFSEVKQTLNNLKNLPQETINNSSFPVLSRYFENFGGRLRAKYSLAVLKG